MAGVLGAAGAVVGLLDVAFSVMHAIRKAKDAIQGTSKNFYSVSAQLDSLEGTLELVRSEACLQTPAVEEALRSLVAEEKKLLRFLESLKVQQEKSKLRQLSHTLKDGDKEDRELDNILSRVHNARSELSIRIQITHVGLTGNQKEGFQVSNDVLMRVGGANAKTLGEGGLQLAHALEQLSPQPDEASNSGSLTAAETAAIEAALPSRATPEAARFATENLEAGDDVAIFHGDIGFDTPTTEGGRHSEIRSVKIGNKAKIGLGDVSKLAAADFFKAWGGGK